MAETLKTSDLTRGEKLYLKRHRLGLTQLEMSVDLGVIPAQYRAMEHDVEGSKAPFISLGAMKPREIYTILRKREGLSRAELAEQMGISEFWVRKMEKGAAPIKRLAEFWGDDQ